jgi:hypothetical protein
MAIEFNCPYCTASIRVPDGKQGSCPKCATDVLVPEVGAPESEETVAWVDPTSAAPVPPVTPPVQPAPPLAQQQPEPAPQFSWDAAQPPPAAPNTQPTWEQPPQTGFPNLGGDPNAPPAAPVSRAVARAKRGGKRRKRKLGGGLLIPILGVVLLGAGLGWYFVQGRETLEGELVGYALDEAEVLPGLIKTSLVDNDLSKETVSFVLNGLDNQPLNIPTGLIRLVLSKGPDGILATVTPGEQTQWYRVKYPSALRQFKQANTARLIKPQVKEREKAAREFFRAWELASDAGEPVDDLLGYRDSLGLNSTVGTLGYHIMAVYEDSQYRCVAETDDSLYFLLSPGAKTFEIRGRTLAGGKKLLDCHYTVTVREEATKKDAAPDEEEPLDDEPSEENPTDGKPKPDGDDRPSDNSDDDS